MAEFVKHTSCDSCGSSDANAIYEDGSSYCFSCRKSTKGNKEWRQEEMTGKIDTSQVPKLPVRELKDRGITQETVEYFGIHSEYSQSNGELVATYAPLYIGDALTGYHKRIIGEGKANCVGLNSKGTDPFGSLKAGSGGKFLIVTEGVEDAMAAHQMLKELGKSYRVVACLGTDRWRKQLSYYSHFEKIVVAFDMDAAGKQAAGEFCTAVGYDKTAIATWDTKYKDPNDLLRAGKAKLFLDALFKAAKHEPDGVLYGEQVWERIKNYTAPEYVSFPPEFEILNEKTKGMRRGEISLWCGGTGCGKTSYIRRIKQHLITSTDWKVGEIELEESPEKTIRGMLQFQGKKRLVEMTPEEKRAAYEATYGTGRLFILDHRARYSRGANLMDKIKYLHYGLGCDIIFLDHITLAVSEFGDGTGNSEQDRMMNEFLEFVETTNTHLTLISHLRKSPASTKSFESGAVPREDDLKGSGSLKQIAFDTYGVSRNKHHENTYERNVSQVHILKCREEGETGDADRMYWDKVSQSLVTAVEPTEENMYEDDEFS